MRAAFNALELSRKIENGKIPDWCATRTKKSEKFKGVETKEQNAKRRRLGNEENVDNPEIIEERLLRNCESVLSGNSENAANGGKDDFKDLHPKYKLKPIGKTLSERESRIWSELERICNRISHDDIAESSHSCYASLLAGVQCILREANLLMIVNLHTIESVSEVITLFTILSTKQGKQYQNDEGKLRKKSMVVLRAALRRTMDARGVAPCPLDDDSFIRFWTSLKRNMVSDPSTIKECVEWRVIWRMISRFGFVYHTLKGIIQDKYTKRVVRLNDDNSREHNRSLMIKVIRANTTIFVEFQSLLAVLVSFFGIRRQTEVRRLKAYDVKMQNTLSHGCKKTQDVVYTLRKTKTKQQDGAVHIIGNEAKEAVGLRLAASIARGIGGDNTFIFWSIYKINEHRGGKEMSHDAFRKRMDTIVLKYGHAHNKGCPISLRKGGAAAYKAAESMEISYQKAPLVIHTEYAQPNKAGANAITTLGGWNSTNMLKTVYAPATDLEKCKLEYDAYCRLHFVLGNWALEGDLLEAKCGDDFVCALLTLHKRMEEVGAEAFHRAALRRILLKLENTSVKSLGRNIPIEIVGVKSMCRDILGVQEK